MNGQTFNYLVINYKIEKITIQSAEIKLVKGDLNGIVRTRDLSRIVMRNIKQNVFFSYVYNSIGVPIAAGILFLFLDNVKSNDSCCCHEF